MHFPPLSLYRLTKKRNERTDDSKHREGSLRAETCKMCKDDVGRRGEEEVFSRRRTNKCKGLG